MVYMFANHDYVIKTVSVLFCKNKVFLSKGNIFDAEVTVAEKLTRPVGGWIGRRKGVEKDVVK